MAPSHLSMCFPEHRVRSARNKRIPQRVHRGLPRREVHRETSEECAISIPHRLYLSTEKQARATSASPEESITDRPVPRHAEGRIVQRISRRPPHTEAHRGPSVGGTVRIPSLAFPSTEKRTCATCASPEGSPANRHIRRHIEARWRRALLASLNVFYRASSREHARQAHLPKSPPLTTSHRDTSRCGTEVDCSHPSTRFARATRTEHVAQRGHRGPPHTEAR